MLLGCFCLLRTGGGCAPLAGMQASGAGSLAGVLEGRVQKANGSSLGSKTFGDVQAGMRGAAPGEAGAAQAVAFTCGFCQSRVVA